MTHPGGSPTKSKPETAPAGSPAADNQPTGTTWTTWSPFPHGLTVRTNLGGLCRRHHRVKGSGWWHVEQRENGIYEWISKITAAAT